MVKEVDVDAFLGYLGEGISKPAIVLASDFERYIMKKESIRIDGETVDFDCMFMNELLAYQIANYLDVPVPEVAIAHLGRELIDNDPEIRFVHKFNEGIHFASKELTNKEENLKDNYQQALRMGRPYIIRSWNSFFNGISNKDDISKIIAFDLLIANFDRFSNTGNLLISTENGMRKMFAIDHGHAFFGPMWTNEKTRVFRSVNKSEYIKEFMDIILNINDSELNGLGDVFRSIETHIDIQDLSSHSFLDIVHKIESINESMLDDWMEKIPNEWFVDKERQISFYKHFVLNQKQLVKVLIQELANKKAFTNFRGGVLEWKREKPTGTL